MNKNEFVSEISKKSNLTKKDCSLCLGLKNPMLLKATPKMLMFGLDTNKYNKPILITSATLKPINGINGLAKLKWFVC